MKALSDQGPISYEVHWRFTGWSRVRVSQVRALDQRCAKDQVWLHHVEASRLSDQIEFLEIKEMMG
jgi:hypothetical protein